MAEQAKGLAIHPNQITQWKIALLDHTTDALQGGPSAQSPPLTYKAFMNNCFHETSPYL